MKIHIPPLLTVPLLLTGCGLAAQPTATRVANSNEYYIACDRGVLRMEDCIAKANAVCPKGYNVVHRSDRGSELAGAAQNITGTSPQNLTVVCN